MWLWSWAAGVRDVFGVWSGAFLGGTWVLKLQILEFLWGFCLVVGANAHRPRFCLVLHCPKKLDHLGGLVDPKGLMEVGPAESHVMLLGFETMEPHL